MRNSNSDSVIVLIHGIRDYALWQSQVRNELRASGFVVELTNYGRFDIFRFLIPVSFFRRGAARKIERQLKIIVTNNPGKKISIIAHSFGTLMLARILEDDFALKLDRIILCGSILPHDFPFEQFQGRYRAPILNEVGTKDVWPAMAESVTWGYGSAGTFGFRRPLVEDRWHNHVGHGDFLTSKFCQKYWVPFIANGEIIGGTTSPSPPPFWIRLISILRVKYLLIFLIILGIYSTYFWTSFLPQEFASPTGGEYPWGEGEVDRWLRRSGLEESADNLKLFDLPAEFDSSRLRIVDFTSFEGTRFDLAWQGIVRNIDFGGAISPFSQKPFFTAEYQGLAKSGEKSLNFAPSILEPVSGATSFSGISYTHQIDVRETRVVWLRFDYTSNTNAQPADIHNCDSSLNVLFRFDAGSWRHRTAQCGSYESETNGDWSNLVVDIPVPVSSTHMELALIFEMQRAPKHTEPLFLLDNIMVLAEPK